MNASNWTVIAIAFLIGGGIFLGVCRIRDSVKVRDKDSLL